METFQILNACCGGWLERQTFHSRLGEVDQANACLRKAFQAAKGAPEWEKAGETITPVVDALESLVAGMCRGVTVRYVEDELYKIGHFISTPIRNLTANTWVTNFSRRVIAVSAIFISSMFSV